MYYYVLFVHIIDRFYIALFSALEQPHCAHVAWDFKCVTVSVLGSGITQWLERRTRDWKVAGSNTCRSGGRVFFSRVNFLWWLLFRYPFHPRVTAVARKRSRSFCQKCRWQVTAKHAYTLPMWLSMKWHCNVVHAWMVYTELAPKRQHFTWHQPCSNQRALPVHHFRGY